MVESHGSRNNLGPDPVPSSSSKNHVQSTIVTGAMAHRSNIVADTSRNRLAFQPMLAGS